MSVTLRPYQKACVEALWDYFREKSGNPLVVVPTGGGKSWIQAAFIRSVLERYPGQRFLLLTHVKELVEQNSQKLEALLPFGSVGVYSAGLRRRELGCPVTVCSVQSVWRRTEELGLVDLVMIDECHRVPTKGEGMYRRLLEDLRTLNPRVKVIGLSATPFRLKSGYLHRGKDRIFTDVAYDVPVLQLIEDGFLCKLRSKSGVSAADLSGVHTRGGEFVASELEAVMNDEDLVRRALDEVEAWCGDRKKWIVFCAGVSHATAVRDAMRQRGITAECVTGKTPREERDRIVADFKAGKFRALTNVNVLTTGFDSEDIDAVVMMRPTKSASLYVQMVGRGLRIHPSKEDCLVLDFAGNIERHGPIDRVFVDAPERKSPGEPLVKTCPNEQCREVLPLSAQSCSVCGFEFPQPEPKPAHDTKASDLPILSRPDLGGLEVVQVHRVDYAKHSKPGKPPSLRVTYWAGLISYREWVCLEHGGPAGMRAIRWWRERSSGPVPVTVDEALEQAAELKVPRELAISFKGKYPEVVSHIGLHLEEAA